MPERPDLEYVVPRLDAALAGRAFTAVTVKKPVVLRVAVPGGVKALEGRRVQSVTRRAHFVCFALDGDLDLIVAPMLAGRFAVAGAKEKSPRDLAVSLSLDDGRALRYRDDVQMGKVYVVARGATEVIPGYGAVGVDVLDAGAFTRERFRAMAKKRRDQVKVFLMDKAALDAMGNAYADEVCWAARLRSAARHRSRPRRPTRSTTRSWPCSPTRETRSRAESLRSTRRCGTS
ncbi:MAG: DNA-formamidopyrimidine glycosylase family protein [Polyangiales bacterium]